MRALDILEVLYKSSSPLKMHAIAELTGVPRSTTYRILRTLVHRGYVSQNLKGEFSFARSGNPTIAQIRPKRHNRGSCAKGNFDSDLPIEQAIEIVLALLESLKSGSARTAPRM